MARAYSQDLRDRVIDAALARRRRVMWRCGLGSATPRRSFGCGGRVRRANARRASKVSLDAPNSTRTAIICLG